MIDPPRPGDTLGDGFTLVARWRRDKYFLALLVRDRGTRRHYVGDIRAGMNGNWYISSMDRQSYGSFNSALDEYRRRI